MARKKESTRVKRERLGIYILIRADDDYVFAFSRSHLTALLVAPKSPAAILFEENRAKTGKALARQRQEGEKERRRANINVSQLNI